MEKKKKWLAKQSISLFLDQIPFNDQRLNFILLSGECLVFSLSCAKLPCLLTETHFILVPAD